MSGFLICIHGSQNGAFPCLKDFIDVALQVKITPNVRAGTWVARAICWILDSRLLDLASYDPTSWNVCLEFGSRSVAHVCHTFG